MQENINSQGRPTPRRRNGRQANKQPGQKMYASENDASANSHAAFGQSPQPFTPAKPLSATPEPYSLQETTSVTKNSRARNTGGKSRARNAVMTSPDSPRTAAARRTPPNNLPSGKVATAYAGSTFHASPAPSALPIPSFYSKGSTSPVPTTTKPQQPSPPPTNREAPTPSRSSLLSAQDSPLEAIFRADRAEKERARRASFATVNGHPNFASPSRPNFNEPTTVPRQYKTLPQERLQPMRSGSGIPLSELDGASAGHVGSPFSTPYHDRIRAAHSHPQPSLGAEPSAIAPGEDPSEALKRVLFGPKAGTSWSPAPMPPAPPPASAPPARANGVAEMEDSLRRILKLT